jgi:hypothetical protein
MMKDQGAMKMKYKIPLDKATIKNAWQYDRPKVIAALFFVIIFWGVFVSATRPTTPAQEKVDFYLVGEPTMTDTGEVVGGYLKKDFPQLKEINIYDIDVVSQDMQAVSMQKLMAYMAGATGDIYIFPKEMFALYAGDGAFMPLDTLVGDEVYQYIDEDIKDTVVLKLEGDTQEHCYGVPIKDVKLFEGTGYDSSNKILTIMVNSENLKANEKLKAKAQQEGKEFVQLPTAVDIVKKMLEIKDSTPYVDYVKSIQTAGPSATPAE